MPKLLARALGLVCMAALLPLVGGCGGSDSASPTVSTRQSDDDYRFTFAVIGDPHIGARDSAYWCKAGSISGKLLANAVRDLNARRPAFTLVMGDISDHGKPAEFQRAKYILDGLQTPYVPLAGNHDTAMGDNFHAFSDTFAARERNYSWDYGGIHFVTANCTNGAYVYPLVVWPHETIDWLQYDLQQNAGKPAIFLCHHNLWPYTSRQSAAEPWPHDAGRGVEEVREVLEGAGNVFMTISGHTHTFRYSQHNGVGYSVVGAPLVYPAMIMYYHVYSDHVVSEPQRLSSGALRSYTDGLAPAAMRPLIDGPSANRNYSVPMHPALGNLQIQ